MAVAAKPYGLFLQSMIEGRLSVLADPLKLMLCTSAYTPNQHTHKFKSIVTNEVVGSGYAAGGLQVTGVSTVYEQANKRLRITGGTVNWPTVIFSGVRYGVLYFDVPGTASIKPLMGYIDFDANLSRSNTPFYVAWPASGIMVLNFS